MDFISLEQLRKYALQESYSNNSWRNLEYFIEELLESGILDDINHKGYMFYPKYLWQENNEVELIFISKESILSCIYNDGYITVKKRMLRELVRVEISQMNLNNSQVELSLIFKDGEKEVFNSNNSNQAWKRKYFTAILEIYKMIA
ncbi:DUF3908 family protein [Halobacillus kuroshimensis]|uniref:DUF3908 family protein n=1 Tax=Halobacillus kuroshimensis TaxID=302481 RepID=UPI0004896997|nr:DUF3908 family protein [Halobacillus kuroshimensis]